jgi:solute carrier family 45, member 1/2/4
LRSNTDTTDREVLEENPGDALAQAGSLGSLSFAIVGFFFTLTLPVTLPYLRSKLCRHRHSQAARIEEQAGNNLSDTDSASLSLIWLWLSTQIVLGILLVLTLGAAYEWQGITLIALAGLPWAVTQWAPWALIGYETSRKGHSAADDEGEENEEEEEAADSHAGAILGVHNMAISLPQVVSGAVSSATYKVAEKAGSGVPTAWVLAISGVAAFVAVFLLWRKVV